MKTRTHEITIGLLLLALSGAAAGQEQNRFLALPVAELARTWLLRNCGISEEPLLEAAIVRRGGELQPLFTRAWDDGPPERLLEGVRASARERYERNRTALQDPASLGLSPEDAKRADARSGEDFVDRSARSFGTAYRGQALRGLLLVGGEEGRRLVEQVATEPGSPLGDTARALLKAR